MPQYRLQYTNEADFVSTDLLCELVPHLYSDLYLSLESNQAAYVLLQIESATDSQGRLCHSLFTDAIQNESLTDLKRAASKTSSNNAARILNRWINLEGLDSVSEKLRQYIVDSFGKKVEIEQLQTLSRDGMYRHLRNQRNGTDDITGRKSALLGLYAIMSFLVIITPFIMGIAFMAPQPPLANKSELASSGNIPRIIKTVITTPSPLQLSVTANITRPRIRHQRHRQRDQRRKIVNISVESYAEYRNTMFDIPEHGHVMATINLTNSHDWPDNAALGNSYQIRHLRLIGNLKISTILSILNGTRHINLLSIENTNNDNCEDDMAKIKGKILLLSLHHLSLENFKSCFSIYRALVDNMVIKSLRSLKIENGTICGNNVMEVQKILQNSNSTMTNLSFPNTNWNAILFMRKLGSFPNMKMIRIDLVSLTSTPINYLGNEFCTVFPNLKYFYSKAGLLPWHQLDSILKCQKLERVVIGLEIQNEDQEEVNLFTFRDNLSNLQCLDVNVHFNNFSGGKCLISGVTDLKKKGLVKSVFVKSNCNKNKQNIVTTSSSVNFSEL